MRFPRRVLAAICTAVAIVMSFLAPVGDASASGNQQEAYGPWWALPTGYGDQYGSAFWLSLDYNGTLVQNEAMQVQNLNEPEDAFDIEICSTANCEVYGPYYLVYTEATEAVDVINENIAAPGYSVYYEACEFDVGCTAKTLTLFNKINNN